MYIRTYVYFNRYALTEVQIYFLTELPPLEDLKVETNLEQNEVMLKWTRPDAEIISSNLTLSYKLFYTVRGVCAISECQGEMCRVQRRIRSRQNSVTVNQELFPYANYTWLLELTYTNDGLTIERYNITVDAQTSQSGEYIINTVQCMQYSVSSCVHLLVTTVYISSDNL